MIRLDDDDQVVMATRLLHAGETVPLADGSVELTDDVPLGFKIAISDLDAGTTVHRGGVPIGRMTAPARAGEIVHTHNLESLYLRTHARGED